MPSTESLPLPPSPVLVDATGQPVDLSKVREAWQDALPEGVRVVLFGGAVRDLFLGRAPRDHDFLVAGASAKALVRSGLEKAPHPFVERFVDPANPMTEVIRSPFSGSPEESLHQMLLTRDFTFHAVGMDVGTGAVTDVTGRGLSDLAGRHLRLVSPAVAEDPMMLWRTFRLLAGRGPGWSMDPVDLERVCGEARTQGFAQSSIHRLDAAVGAVGQLTPAARADFFQRVVDHGLRDAVQAAMARVADFRQTGVDPQEPTPQAPLPRRIP